MNLRYVRVSLKNQLGGYRKSLSSNAELRRQRHKNQVVSKPRSTSATGAMALSGILVLSGTAAVAYMYYEIRQNPKGYIASLYKDSYVKGIVDYLYAATWGQFETILKPTEDQLIPDWGTDPYYNGQIPKGTPAPILLVLDLEKCIIGSEHTAKLGWRHVKRPGLDQFLLQLRQYYEIVIFSENPMPDLLDEVDKEHCCLKIGPAAAELKNNVLMKRLDVLNREERKIILIDDDPKAAQLFPRNTLLVRPFVDVKDKSDRILLDLIPLLQALVHENVDDVRDTLDYLGTHDAHEAVVEYQMRLANKLRKDEVARNRGLGGLLREGMASPNMDDVVQGLTLDSSKLFGMEAKAPGLRPRPKEDEGAKVVRKKKGGLWSMQESFEQEQEEKNRRMQEAMQQAYMEKMSKKAELEAKKNKNKDLL